MSLVDHLITVIDIWWEMYGDNINQKNIKALKETLHLTARGFYE